MPGQGLCCLPALHVEQSGEDCGVPWLGVNCSPATIQANHRVSLSLGLVGDYMGIIIPDLPTPQAELYQTRNSDSLSKLPGPLR